MSTLRYGWTAPTVGASDGTWGQILNDAIDAIDADLFDVETLASGALPKAGGTMTGNLSIKTETLARQDLGTVSGAVSLTPSTYQAYTMSIGGAATLSIAGPPGGNVAFALLLKITNGGTAVTFPASFKFVGGVTPSLSAAGTDLLIAVSFDNGATYQVAVLKGFA